MQHPIDRIRCDPAIAITRRCGQQIRLPGRQSQRHKIIIAAPAPPARHRHAKNTNLLEQKANADPDAIFVGATTFEHDIILASERNRCAIVNVLTELLGEESGKDLKDVEAWKDDTPYMEELLKMISTVGGKGRFAQRLMSKELDPPAHLADALKYLQEL
jgi:putative ATP-dependent endonuclease of OLD family